MQAKAMIKEPLPALLEPPSHTKTSAIHPTSYRGPLLLWDSFESEARNNLNSTQWSKATICFAAAGTPGPCNAAENEQIYCGAEGSIEGRIQSNIGAVMSAVCRAQGVNLVFGDYAATKDAVTGKEAPDLLIMTRDGLGRAIGEGKVPWVVPAHDLDATVRKGGSDLRRLLGMFQHTISPSCSIVSQRAYWVRYRATGQISVHRGAQIWVHDNIRTGYLRKAGILQQPMDTIL